MPTYKIYNDTTSAELVGAEASIPQGTPINIRNAILKADMCDFALLVFLPHVAHVLEKIGARVDWLTLYMQPVLRLFRNGESLRERVLHSVFIITTSNANQFIADFTIEQFGYNSRHWITPKSEYLIEFSADGTFSIAADGHMDLVRLSANQCDFMAIFQHIADDVCSQFDWGTYCRHQLPDRLPWVRALVRNARRNIETA